MTLEAARLLRAYPCFGTEPAAITQLLEGCERRTFAPGEILCREKAYEDELYFVLAGTLEVSRLDTRGQPQVLARLEAPQILGQLALIDGSARSATVTARSPVEARAIPKRAWVRLARAAEPAGTALRRLLLSALHQQLTSAHSHLTNRRPPTRASVVVEDDDYLDDIHEALAGGGPERG